MTTAAAQTTANEAEAGEGAAAGDEAELLDVIEVRAAGATTEGSGSFAASEASIGRGIGSTQDLPQTVTVVTQRVLEERNLTTLDSAMTETPGIVAKTEGYGFPSFYSRGFIIDNYQIDELSTSYTSGFRPDFDMALYDRLEVLRGAEALFSGAGEPGGTINLARKRPTGSFAASGALSYGSWDNRRIEADIGGPLAFDGRLRGRAIGVAQDQEFFYSPSDEKKHVAYGILEYDLTPLTLVTAGASYQRQNGVTWQQGLPTFDDGTMLGLPRDVALTADWATREQTVKEVFASVEHAFTPDWTAKLSAMRQDFDFDYLNLNVGGPVYAATGAFRDSTSGSESDGNTSKIIDASLSGAFDAWGRRHGLLVGANWQESHGSQLRYLVEPGVLPGALTIDDFPNPDLPKPEVLGLSYGWPEWGSKQRGIYGRLNLEATQRMNVILGARYADYRYSDTSQSYDENGDPFDTSTVGYEDNGIFVPYLGVTYALTPAWTAYASLSETYVPQANYLSGPPDAATPLDAITGRNYEVGVKGLLMGGVLTGSAALYRIERDGEAVEDSRYVPTGGFASCCYVAQGEVVSQGVELELAGELAPGWQVFGGYTYNDNQNKTENAVYSEFTPKHLLKLWTSYDLPRDYSRWTVGGGVTAMSGQANSGLAWIYDANAGWSQEPFRIEQGGYAVWDAFAQYRIAEGWDLALNVNNVFDRTYYATLGTPTGGNWYGQPRTAYLTLRARF